MRLILRSRQRVRAATLGFLLALLASVPGCGDSPVEPPPATTAVLRVEALLGTQAVDRVVVEVTAADITTPLVFNLTVSNGTASGTITVPTGSDRIITVRAYDAGAIETHRGAKTVDVVAGVNPTISIRIDPLQGDQPINVTIGTFIVTVTPTTATIDVGGTVQLSATVVDTTGQTVVVTVLWATLNPAIATVSASGLVTGETAGTVDVVATYAGVGAAATITVQVGEGLIVFDYYNGTNRDIYRIDPDGTGLTQLTNFVGGNAHTSNEYPSVSSDRAKIVFTREWNIWTMKSDGSNQTQLTFVAPNTLPQVSSQWSFDGTKIVWESQFACCVIANREIHTMNADGSSNVRLTNNAIWDGWPSWSPDGAWIVYSSGEPGDIYRMDASGGNVTRLTNNAAWDDRAIYSPDGTKIVFCTDRDGPWEVYVMQADGTQQTRLTVSPAGGSRYPNWSPDGQRIVFASDRAGTWDLYLMNADGSGVTQLTTLASPSYMMASWR